MGFLRRVLGGDRPDGDPAAHVHLDDADVDAPGWDAIDGALAPIYGDQEPKHYGTILKFALGGPDPLDGVSIYEHPGPPAHWHYVSYGMSELYEKQSDDPERSGWGVELTFRLDRDGSPEAPVWPISLMQNLARYVYESGNVLLPNHHMNANGPIAQESATALEAVLCAADSELGEIATPNGRVTFVQLIGITLDELASIKAWSSSGWLALWQEANPLLVTDLDRASLLSDPSFAAEVERRTEAEGSMLSGLNVDVLDWEDSADGVELTLGALSIDAVVTLLRQRVSHGLDGWVQGPGASVVFHAGTAWSRTTQEQTLSLSVTPDMAITLAATLAPRVGRYAIPEAPGLVVRVEETIVRDARGDEIGRVG